MTLARTPIFAVLVGLLAIGMLAVSLQAASEANWRDARGFLYPAIFCGFAGLSIAVLFARKSEGQSAEAELGSLLTIWLLLPFFAALPLFLLTPSIGRPAAVFEMMAALTTTGGSVYSKASSASDAIHLWRGICR
jgi:trk system potassium uptake protein TrkH